MHLLRLAALALLVSCDPAPSADGKSPSADDTASAPVDTGTSPVDTDSGDDTDTDTAGDTGTADCREEGESCTPAEEGWGSDCCNSRHTCFPEGCYYSQPG